MQREWSLYNGKQLQGLESLKRDSKKLIILLHGVGSNEKDLLSFAASLGKSENLISLRSPIELNLGSYAWFHVQFTSNGPVHNVPEALYNFQVLQNEIKYISETLNIPLNQIYVFGFSQGGIMTMGLALQGKFDLGGYIICSARTLPEFAENAKKNVVLIQQRNIYIAHGVLDDKLPLFFGQRSKSIVEEFNGNLTYKEYNCGHTIAPELATDVAKWINRGLDIRKELV